MKTAKISVGSFFCENFLFILGHLRKLNYDPNQTYPNAVSLLNANS